MSERHGLVPLSFVRIPMRENSTIPKHPKPKATDHNPGCQEKLATCASPQKKIQALCVAFPVQNICKPKFIESVLGVRSLTLRSRRLITQILNCYWKNQANFLLQQPNSQIGSGIQGPHSGQGLNISALNLPDGGWFFADVGHFRLPNGMSGCLQKPKALKKNRTFQKGFLA